MEGIYKDQSLVSTPERNNFTDLEINMTSMDMDMEKVPGTLKGHSLPVVGWFTVGLAYLFLSLRHIYICRQQGSKFTSAVELPFRRRNGGICGTIPLSALTKIVFGGYYTGYDLMYSPIWREAWQDKMPHIQHDTMATCFFLSGVVDLIYLSPKARRILPDGMDFALFAATFTNEALQFVFHLHGRSPVDVRLHLLQASIAVSTTLTLILEFFHRNSPFLTMLRAQLIVFQGTWMTHLMLILYHPMGLPSMDLHSHENVNLVSLYFCWHVIFNMTLVFFTDLAFARMYRHSDTNQHVTLQLELNPQPLLTRRSCVNPYRPVRQ